MTRKMYDVPLVTGDKVLLELELDSDNDTGLKSSLIEIVDSTKERYLLSANTGKVLKLGINAVEESIIDGHVNTLLPGHIVKFYQNAGVVYKNDPEEVGNDRMFRIIHMNDIVSIIGEDFDD